MDLHLDLSSALCLRIKFNVYHAVFQGPQNTSRFYAALCRYMDHTAKLAKPFRVCYADGDFVIMWYARDYYGYSPGRMEEFKKGIKDFVCWWLIQHAVDAGRDISDSLIRRSVVVEDRSGIFSRLLNMVVEVL